METRVYLSLGSNLGDRATNLVRALNLLVAAVRVERLSSVYETAPVGVTDQPAFLNVVAEGITKLTPDELLEAVKAIEWSVGRRPGRRWGPRIIDIDIILFGDLILDQDNLTIPHPRTAERAFVLIPLAEIAAGARNPRSGQTIGDLMQSVNGRDGVRLVGGPEMLLEPGERGVRA